MPKAYTLQENKNLCQNGIKMHIENEITIIV